MDAAGPSRDRTGAIRLAFSAVGRLRPSVSPEQAATEVSILLNVDRSPADPRPRLEARVVPLKEEMVRGFRPALFVLSGVTALVLVISCINVAGFFLAHGAVRRREVAVRGALGAGRGRIVRQLLTESVALTITTGTCGIVSSSWSRVERRGSPGGRRRSRWRPGCGGPPPRGRRCSAGPPEEVHVPGPTAPCPRTPGAPSGGSATPVSPVYRGRRRHATPHDLLQTPSINAVRAVA